MSATASGAAAATLREALAGRRLIVVVGNGGVGKTSVAAAMAYGRACSGEAVGVLTVDPAPRLGDALGVPTIDADPKSVALPDGAAGSLTAMRLDTKRTFDRLVQQQAATPEAAEALLAHPIYRAISEQLGGTDSYMAFQRLHELVEQGSDDVLVIDTPPAANAAQLLSAPARLAGLVETRALSVLAQPALIAARAGGRLARAAFLILLAAVERVTGARVQRDVAMFGELFGELLGGLEGRTRQIDELLRAPSTAFVLVTRPVRSEVAAALAFRSQLAQSGIDIAAIVVNRILPAENPENPGQAVILESATEIQERQCGSAARRLAAQVPVPGFPGVPEHLQDTVRRMETDIAWLRAGEREAIVELLAGMESDGGGRVYFLENRAADVTTLDDIAGLAEGLGYAGNAV